jgi:NAD(P)H-hydrate epimerase
LIEQINASGRPAIALDLPSGLDASSGVTPGVCVEAEKTVTLALPKPGLTNPAAGALILADIGIPPAVYQRIGIETGNFWGLAWRLPLRRVSQT